MMDIILIGMACWDLKINMRMKVLAHRINYTGGKYGIYKNNR